MRFTSLRLLFAYAARKNLDIFHLDVETAFLHGDMDSIVYLQQPQGFEVEGEEDKVCLLKKAIYGLKQGSRNWNLKLDQALKKMNMKQSDHDECIYSFITVNKCIVAALFVDDIIIFTNSIDFFKILKDNLAKICTIKDLGPIQRCLGINVTRNRQQGYIALDQRDYIQSILKNFGMHECRPTSTPMDPNADSSFREPQNEESDLKNIPYQNAVGSLMYLAQATRPDLAFAISTVSRFNQSFNMSHWNMIKRIFRYLQGTKDLVLKYSAKESSDIVGYCDASWASNTDDPRSTTGYVFTCQGGAISWNSRKQTTVALSSTEAEYLSLSAATQEAIWLRRLSMQLLIKEDAALQIFCDNKGAIDLSKNSKFSARTKHINVRHHFIKENIRNREIKVDFTPSFDMLADPLTKAVNSAKL